MLSFGKQSRTQDNSLTTDGEGPGTLMVTPKVRPGFSLTKQTGRGHLVPGIKDVLTQNEQPHDVGTGLMLPRK